ncbi:MAG: TolC family protein [Pseudomonadota bacterium]
MRYAFIWMLACMATPIAQATPETAPSPLTLQQVIGRVLERNPQLAIHDFERQAAAARTRQAEQSTPYELRMELANLAGSGAYQGIDRLESTLSLIRLLETRELRASRRDLAQQHTLLLRNEQDSQRLDLLAHATEQFIHVVVDQHKLRIAEDHLTLVRHTHEIVSQRVKAGRSHIAEQRRLEMALARAEIELEHAEHELNTSRLKLAAFWGESQPDFGSATADLVALPSLPPFAQLETLLTDNPDLVRFASEERIAQARVKLAQARRAAPMELSGGLRYFNDVNDAALTASISIPLGAGSRARPEIDEMQALSAREPLRFEQRRLALRAGLYELYQEALHARTAFEALHHRIIPAAQLAAEDYETGYQSGRFSLLELNEAQGALLDARREAVLAAANYHRLSIEIERLTGAALRTGEPS